MDFIDPEREIQEVKYKLTHLYDIQQQQRQNTRELLS